MLALGLAEKVTVPVGPRLIVELPSTIGAPEEAGVKVEEPMMISGTAVEADGLPTMTRVALSDVCDCERDGELGELDEEGNEDESVEDFEELPGELEAEAKVEDDNVEELTVVDAAADAEAEDNGAAVDEAAANVVVPVMVVLTVTGTGVNLETVVVVTVVRFDTWTCAVVCGTMPPPEHVRPK